MKIKIPLLLFAALGFRFCAGAGTITNGAPITPNLMFVLNQDSGANSFTNQFKSDEVIDYTVLTIGEGGGIFNRQSANTPEVFFRQLPENQSFEFRLFDRDGREVPKTKRGIELSTPVMVPSSSREVTHLLSRFAPVGAFHIFRPEDVFVITNQGIYEMELRLRIWAQTTNSCNTNYEIMGHFDQTIGTNACFSIVTSAPVRVKIVKRQTGNM